MGNSVTIGNIKASDIGLVLTSFEIGLPEPKRETVNVQGRDGVLDLTSGLFDETFYNNRSIEIEFVTGDTASGKSWVDLFSYVASQWHGKYLNVQFDDDSYYWHGFVTISSHVAEGGKRTIQVEVDADPYKTDGTNKSL